MTLFRSQKVLFKRAVGDITLNHIQTMNYDIIGLEETLLGIGQITIQTYLGDIVISHVHHPAHTQKQIFNILRELHIAPEQYPEPNAKEDEKDYAQIKEDGTAPPNMTSDIRSEE